MKTPLPLDRRRFLGTTTVLAAALALPCLAPRVHAASEPGATFRSDWDRSPDRIWLGAACWANPLQDWHVRDGRIECDRAAADRNVHVLTRQLAPRAGNVVQRVRIGRADGPTLAGRGSAGFRVGILGSLRDVPELHDYRNNLWPTAPSGFNAGFTGDGRLFLGRVDGPNSLRVDLNRPSVELELSLEPKGTAFTAQLIARDPANGTALGQVSLDGISGETLVGNLALVCNFPVGDGAAKGKAKAAKASGGAEGPGLGRFWFADWRIEGSKVTANDAQAFGPILWSQYTLSGGTLKLSAQFPPLGAEDQDTATLQIQDDTSPDWRTVATAQIHPEARVAAFRIDRWDSRRDTPYRIVYALRHKGGSTQHVWTGVIRHDPVERDVLTVADVSCNIHTVFPNTLYVRNMARLDPDLLAFVGDQFYENCGGFGTQRAPADKAALDYLRKWYFHGWTWRELMRDRPSISLPDDHDVYQGNLWGEGGEGQKTTQEAGGYELPAPWVNVVHRTQTSHHPDPYDPRPSKRDTINYYGPMTYGRVSFAILADRQFKSGPEGKVPPTGDRADHVVNPNYNPATADLPGLELLGATQERFLQEWVQDWRGADMKAVLSQTVFTAMATTHGNNHEILMADYDASGWPQTARRRALREIRKGFAVHLAGDQHLPAVVQYGIDAHGDGPVAFAGPAVNVGYPRWWEPAKTGRNKTTGNPDLTGRFLDHFGHPLTVLAVKSGPYEFPKPVLEAVNAKTSGLGVVRFNKNQRTITFECWPYLADVTRPGTQMETWPVTVQQRDNYGRQPVGYLPEVRVRGLTNPVLQVFDEASGDLVYALRLNGSTFRPPVFAPGTYRISVGDQDADRMQRIDHVAAPAAADAVLDVGF